MKKFKIVLNILSYVVLFILLTGLNLISIYLIELFHYLGRFFPYVFVAFLPALLLGRLSRRSFKKALVRGVLPFLTALAVYTIRVGARSGWLRFGGWFLDLWWIIALYLAGLAAFMYFGWFCRFQIKIVRRWAVPAVSMLLLFLTAMQAYSFFTGLIGKFSSVPDLQNKSYGEALRGLCDCLEREYPYFAYKKIDWPKIKEQTLASLPKIKTDDDFTRIVIGLVNELQDGHLRARPRTWKSDLKDKASLGARFVQINGTLAIAKVIPKSGAAEAGLKPGMVLCRVNGRHVGEVLAGVPDYAINSKSGSIRGERQGVLHRLTWLLTQGDNASDLISQNTCQNPDNTIGIVRHPRAADYSKLPGHGKLASLPVYDPNSKEGWQVDIRSADLTALNLKERLYDLMHADFDTKTRWPNTLPQAFKPGELMGLGKNPGLKIRELHKKGITGRGVSIAIIDQCLLVDHIEYKDRIKFYEEIPCLDNDQSSMHGPAVASIAIGKTVGVAPDSNLFYIAETHGIYDNHNYEWDFTYLARSIDRILEINRTLPKNDKIRVISIAVGWSPQQKGYKEVVDSVNRAKVQGIFVVSSSLYETHDHKFFFHGLGRNSLKDPDSFDSYEEGSWWSRRFYSGERCFPIDEALLVPMDSRCTASPTGVEDYVFYSNGGWSWSIPYIAGLYALACQVKPDITPDIFWKEALKIGEIIEVEKDSKKYKLGKIVNPLKLIENLQEKK